MDNKIIITNNTDLPMKSILNTMAELYQYPINGDEVIAFKQKKYFCYIKKNRKSINFIFDMKEEG